MQLNFQPLNTWFTSVLWAVVLNGFDWGKLSRGILGRGDGVHRRRTPSLVLHRKKSSQIFI